VSAQRPGVSLQKLPAPLLVLGAGALQLVAPPVAYQKDGAFGHTVEDYLPQFATTAALCNLDYQGAMYTNGVSYSARDDEAKINAQRELAENHGARLVAKLKELAA